MSPPSTRTPADLAFAQILRARGLRATTSRRAVYGVFAGPGSTDRANVHLSAEDVFQQARLRMPELSRGTVSHALGELVDVGLLGAVESAGPQQFEANVTAHHHFRCTKCRELRDIAAANVEVTVNQRDVEFERTHVLIEGLCPKCAGRVGAA